MTTIVSRLYADEATANRVLGKLSASGHPSENIDMFGSSASAADLVASGLDKASAAGYAAALSPGAALLVVRAPFVPFGAARDAMASMDSEASLAVQNVSANRHIEAGPDHGLALTASTKREHWLVFTRPDEIPRSRMPMSKMFGMSLLSAPRERRSAMRGGRLMMGTTVSSPSKHSVISGGKRFLYNPG